jgi:hypothetical protein
MPTIFEITNDALETLSVPFAMDIFLAVDGVLPDLFLVYQLVAGVPEQHADNAETERSYLMQVNIMSRSGLAVLPNVDAAMTAAGYTKGPERQLPRDPETRHFILSKDYYYLKEM